LLSIVIQKEDKKMKFSGIDMQGYFRAEIIVDASTLVWNSSDERRVVYDETSKQLWIADDTEWKSTGTYTNIPEGTEMWVYADSAPVGWSISSSWSGNDELVAVKGGGTYTTGGALAGNFTTPAHSHVMGSHTHTASGTVNIAPGANGSDGGFNRALIDHYHSITLGSGAPLTASTLVDGGATGYRPLARVGSVSYTHLTLPTKA